MDRSSRRAKPVNYRESMDFDDDDDDDFASARAPPSKRSREHVKQQHRKSSSQESNSASSQKSRKPLEEKLLDRDLEAAITLSLLNNAETNICERNINVEPLADENTDPSSLLLSNCSVNAAVLGLDEITSEKVLPPSSRQSRAEEPRRKLKEEEDDDYQPKMTPDSDSDEDFSEAGESEDEEFTVKKAKRKKKEVAKKKMKSPPATKKEKQPSKSKTVAAAATTSVRAPPAAKPALKRPISNTAPSPSKPAVSPSPAGGKMPRWNPPGQVGKSPSSSYNTSVRSPGQGLRLGLSRLVRVKPLHPSDASH